MGFLSRFVGLIKHAIEYCWFTILVNGEPSSFFKSSQGLRQGDPISLALFILIAEAISRRIGNFFSHNPDMIHQTGYKTRVTHLAYANDIIMFTRCEEQPLIKLMQFLESYETTLGSKLITLKVFSSLVRKPIPSLTESNPSLASTSIFALSLIWDLLCTKVKENRL
ncbi:hypothetical protein Sango_2831600 [Sesamum angolense]|uniref:Reverse transcriptase domain-containing protein n=1 Tax=Sesamum angolense TaxID=2727404 RepID=A0AAE1T6J6_9LAMI|nr:hypothetical protein Sango_2831600 [Sesamum angolense]